MTRSSMQNQRPFSCPVCRRSFRSHSSLKQHMDEALRAAAVPEVRPAAETTREPLLGLSVNVCV